MSLSVGDFSMKRQDERERERTQKYFIVNSSRSLFRILLFFCCRSSLNGIRDFISYTLHFYTQYIEWYKAGRRSRQVRKRTEVASWARKSLFPSIACNFVYFELESETKARAEKNLKFPIFHAEAWTEITNHQKKKQVLNAKQLQLVGRHFQLSAKNFPTFLRGMAETFATLIRPESTENPSQPPASVVWFVIFDALTNFPNSLSTSVSSSEKTTMNSLWWWDLNLNRQRTFASSQAPTLLAVTAAQKNVSKKVVMMNDFLTRLEFSLSCVRARATFLVCCDDDGVRKFLHGKNIQNPARSVRKKNEDERWFFFHGPARKREFLYRCAADWLLFILSLTPPQLSGRQSRRALSTSSIGEWRN